MLRCFGANFTHVQTCDNVRVHSATQWNCFGTYFAYAHTEPVTTFVFMVLRNGLASVHTLHIPKPVITFVFMVLRNGLLRYKLCTCPNLVTTFVFVVLHNGLLRTYFTHPQACDNVCVHGATQWTASVHTLHMSKPLTTFVFIVLRNGLLRYILAI